MYAIQNWKWAKEYTEHKYLNESEKANFQLHVTVYL